MYNINHKDDDCNCKETPYDQRVVVYLQGNRSLRESVEDAAGKLKSAMVGYTYRQAKTAIDFANTRGECMIFEGSREDAISVVDKLVQLGIYCQVRPRRTFK